VGDRWQAVVPPWDDGPAARSVERGDYAVFAPDEADRWWLAGDEWTRHGSNPMRLRVAPSSIEGAGEGLFATQDLKDGQPIGRMHGTVVFGGSEDACED
jgi:hypothetical protein